MCGPIVPHNGEICPSNPQEFPVIHKYTFHSKSQDFTVLEKNAGNTTSVSSKYDPKKSQEFN